MSEGLLKPAELRRYADAIVKASLGVGKGETLVVRGNPAHRELVVAVAEAAYRAGAHLVDVQYTDPLVMRARLEHGKDDALGVVSSWNALRLKELMKPHAAEANITGETDPGFLDGISPKRIQTDHARTAKQIKAYQRASLDMKVRWTIAAWPTDVWASKVYPELALDKAKKRLAQDLLWFCRLTDRDGKGSTGWLTHLRALSRRSAKLSKLELKAVELRAPGTELNVRLAPDSRWLGGLEATPAGVQIAANMPTEETFTSPHMNGAEGTFSCTFPLLFQGRLIDGLRGEFRGGKLVRLEAKRSKDRDFVANYLDSDPTGHGRRLGEVALVDESSRIGKKKRTYYSTLLDENAAAHFAFGAGFGGTRTTKPAKFLNDSSVHLDVMIGGPDLEVTGITEKGRRVPVIRDGLWQI